MRSYGTLNSHYYSNSTHEMFRWNIFRTAMVRTATAAICRDWCFTCQFLTLYALAAVITGQFFHYQINLLK